MGIGGGGGRSPENTPSSLASMGLFVVRMGGPNGM